MVPVLTKLDECPFGDDERGVRIKDAGCKFEVRRAVGGANVAVHLSLKLAGEALIQRAQWKKVLGLYECLNGMRAAYREPCRMSN